MTDRKIEHMEGLLHDIADGLEKHANSKIADLEVVLTIEGDVVLITSVPTALNYLANDTYWGEYGSWDKADKAEVRSI